MYSFPTRPEFRKLICSNPGEEHGQCNSLLTWYWIKFLFLVTLTYCSCSYYVLSLTFKCCLGIPLIGLTCPFCGLLVMKRVSSSLEKSDSDTMTLLFWILPAKAFTFKAADLIYGSDKRGVSHIIAELQKCSTFICSSHFKKIDWYKFVIISLFKTKM